MPFLNVVDPAFDFTAPEVLAAQAEGWYADSPLGPIVLRYAEAQELLRGLVGAAGTFLTVAVQTAQRDPRAYPGGDTFDLTVARDAALLQFGGGPHYCLGAALARAELGEALPILARRFGPPAIAGEGDLATADRHLWAQRAPVALRPAGLNPPATRPGHAARKPRES